MNQIDQREEWDFVRSEITHLHRSDKSYLTRELIFVAHNLLTLYCIAVEDMRKSFLASIYLQTKKRYLEGP